MQFLRGYSAFLDYRYWLNPQPVPLGPSLAGGIFAFFAWFIAAAMVLWFAARWLRKRDQLKSAIARKFASLLWVTGALGLVVLFFAYEQSPFFGMRVWFLPVAMLFLVWLAKIVIVIVRDYPHEKQKRDENQRFRKYLPGKK